ncbi:MAG: hypothetical protein EOP48_14455 [Sphingobacteriales bacterium]|nr:MAG: hypothetical protein EOP48_14455 [Sphingobacteriales bacterium]
MSRQSAPLLLGLILFPFFAFAHGEEVLLPLFAQLGSIFIFLIWITSIKFRLAYKLLLAASYFLTLSLILAFTWNVPYKQNRTFLDIAWAITPAVITLFIFIALRKKNKRETKHQTN